MNTRLLRTTAASALLAVLAVAGVVPVPAPTAAAAVLPSRCNQRTPTIVATSGVAEGTHGADVIVAAAGVTVHGRGGNDRICTEGGHVQGGKGNDRIILLNTGTEQRGDIEAGSGHDSLGLGDPDATDVAVYLDGRATWNWDGLRVDIRLDGVEDLRVAAMRAYVRGDRADNNIVIMGCEAFALGGAGADVLFMMRRRGTCPPPEDRYTVTFIGVEGNDEMFGTGLPDKLLGGPGRDEADGGQGSGDKCRAEVQRLCD